MSPSLGPASIQAREPVSPSHIWAFVPRHARAALRGVRVVETVPTLRGRPYARRWTTSAASPRKNDLAVSERGGLVQLDTSSST